MKQEQKIGHQSQEQGVKGVKQRSHIHQPPVPGMQEDEKPAITDEKGNKLEKHHTSAGKGYNEEKQTDSGSDHPEPTPHEQQVAKVPFDKEHETSHKKAWGEQEKHEEEEKSRERARQAENVKG